ncbi:MAG: hypothetical protein EZS28_044988, partial [Streblomastix strix]
FLTFSIFRNTLRTIGNEGDSDKVGQLFDSIQSQKTKGRTKTNIWSQESIQNNSTFGSRDKDCPSSRSDKLHSRFSEQIEQLRRLQYKPTACANPISLVEPRANSGFIRKPIQCDSTSLCINRPEGLECAMDRSIYSYIGERNPLDQPTYPNDILDFNDIQTVLNYSDCGGTLMARTTLVHNSAIRKLKMDYPWTIEQNPDSGSKYDSETSPSPTRQVSSLPHGYIKYRALELLTKFLDAVGLSRQAQALLIGGQKFQSIKRYYYATATLDDWMKSKQYSIQDVLRKKPGFIISDVMARFTGQHSTPKSSFNRHSCIKAMLQLIFDREPMHDTPSALTYRAISNCYVQQGNMLMFGTQIQYLTFGLHNQQIRFCFLRITEISEIDLNLSNINFDNRTALVTLSPKTTNALKQYEVKRTGILNLCPNVTTVTWLERLIAHFHHEIPTLASLFWTEQWKP